MQIVIDIPEDIYNHIVVDSEYFTPSLVNAFKNGTPIPDNATNRDVMKIIFPKIGVYDEWYDEPYQKGGKE